VGFFCTRNINNSPRLFNWSDWS